MSEFTASNGVIVGQYSTSIGTRFAVEDSEPAPTGTGRPEQVVSWLDPRQVSALREFFEHERDEALGRWRWPENPDYVVYRRGDGLLALSEQSGNTKFHDLKVNRVARSRSSILDQAITAYFEAHPERKPWEDAREGEVWIITPSKSLTLGEKVEYPAIFQADRFRDHGGSWDASEITDARRIWPESD